MAAEHDRVRYELDENPPLLLTIGAGLQAALIIVAPVILTVVVVMRIGDQPQSYISWAVFAALIVSGATTALQAIRIGHVGSGHILIMGTSGAFLAVCVAALVNGGPGLMATLIVASSIIQFVLASRLSLMRRLFTPVVAGTMIMLIAVSVMPVVLDILNNVPESAAEEGALVAAATIAVIAGLVLRAPPALRLWSPVIGIVAGSLAAAPFGLYDVQQIFDAPWIGFPVENWPGLDLGFSVDFWALLPAFAIVTLVGAIETIGDGVAIQRISRRRVAAPDFRVVQGAINADGVGNLFSGLAGTVPNTTYSSSISLTDITGIASRRVGIAIGLIFIAFAFFPKIAAVVIAIPGPVAAAYLLLLLGILFVQGMRIVVQDGLDHRKALIVGLSFWIGASFTTGRVFPDILGEGFLEVLLDNGMTSGAIAALCMMLFLEFTSPRRKRLRVPVDNDLSPKLSAFLHAFAEQSGWNESATRRLVLVGEETLTSLLAPNDEAESTNGQRRLVLSARREGATAELEFVSGAAGENLEDRLSYLGESADINDETELSFRLLRHYASSVRHSKYYGVDIVTVHVERSA